MTAVSGRTRLAALVIAVFAALAAFMMFSASGALASTPNTALILADSVTVPGPPPAASTESIEQYEAEQDGFTVTSVDGTQWDAMTAAQFASYQVIIIGDPTCGDTTGFQAAVTNESVWEPVVMSSGGNKVLIGTDPTYHYSTGSGPTANILEKNGIAFAGAVGGATGAYVDLSCAYSGSAPGTPVPLLDGLSSHGPGSFTVGGAPCAGSISIITQSGPTSGLHDSDLSGWSCSVHEFFDKFPSDYTPLALATDPSVPVTYSGTDVDTGASVQGSPYIMMSGAGVSVKSNLVLSPATQTLATGSSATVTGNLTSGGSPVSGNSVTFDITAGPDSGKTFTGTTDASGNVPFTFTNTGGAGTDQVVGTTVVSGVTEQGTATVTFGSSSSDTPIVEARGFTVHCVTMCKDLVTVGRFEDLDRSELASDYTATIDWGDGSTSAGAITKVGRVFWVTGQHGYSAPGTYTVTVTITDADGPSEPTITSSAVIVPRPSTTVGAPATAPTAPAKRATTHTARKAHKARHHAAKRKRR